MNYIDKLNYIFENTSKCHICNEELSCEYGVVSNSILQKKCIAPCIGRSFAFYISRNIINNSFIYSKFKVFSPENKEYITFYFDKNIIDIGGTMLDSKYSGTIIELYMNEIMLNSLIQIEPPFINEEKIKGYLLFM